MTKNTLRAFLAVSALAIGSSVAMGCVADRPSRNGVFNDSQYLRKAFLVQAADATTADPGWFMKATIMSTSTPNPYAELNLFTGAEGTQFVRFGVTSDTLEMLNMRELSAGYPDQATRTAELLNAWSATNVDIKYRVNLDGEKTNFLEENQELDWQQRQYVKINFGKNTVSDLAALGGQATAVLNQCADAANAFSTLVPNSFRVDEASNYMQWAVQVTLPFATTANAACTYGAQATDLANKLPRQATVLNVLYSFTRAAPLPDPKAPGAYQPLEIAEKDPIRRKYGTIDTIAVARDQQTGLVGARQLANRFDPAKPLVYYFAPGYPEQYKKMFTDPQGIVDQTNALFADAKAAIRLSVKNFDEGIARPDGAADCDPKAVPAACTPAGGIAPGQACLKDPQPNTGFYCGYPRSFGDVRYNFIRWEDDIDTGSPFIGVTQFVPDPRTGELISSSINIANFQLADRVTARLDFYLESIGAQPTLDPVTGEWPPGPANCKDGDVIPFDPAVTALNHNGKSTVYAKMQEYLQKPAAVFGKLGPQDFVVPQDADFFNAYFQMIPYQLYADPSTNFFVTPEGGKAAFGPVAQAAARAKNTEFHSLMADLDRGVAPYDTSLGAAGLASGAQFLDKFHHAQLDHKRAMYMKNFNHGTAQFDDAGLISLLQVFQRDARHCINGVWETRKAYLDNLLQSYHALTVWHEFGHAIGLDHNFMASVDRPNFPHYKDGAGRDHVGMYQSSVMEYNATPDRVFWKNASGGQGWGPYDQGAISFIYANTKPNPDPKAKAPGISGQTSSSQPWNDPHGYKADAKTEQAYLFCNANHLQYSPLCRQFDFGSTPSEIISAEIDAYEWNYKWRNFRLYRKFADFSAYADGPTQTIHELRRFMPMWTFDWSKAEITDTLRRIGVAPPTGAVAATYYDQLVDKFTADISAANAMAGAFHEALIQQGSGERPYKTIYDNFYGDTTQQGIFIDKLVALQSWTDIWQVDNFDPDQAGGVYLSSYSSEFGDPVYQTVAETAVDSMIGGQYDVFPFARPLAVMQFSKATHDVNFGGRTEIRDWTGGKVFFREQDFLNFFRTLQVQFHTKMSPQSNVGVAPFTCADVATCPYDPRVKQESPSDINHSDSYNEFLGPDNRRYAWVFVQDRNQWVVVDRDRNTAAYLIVRNYNTDVIKLESDGNFGPDLYGDLRQVKYFMDLFQQYN
jgi:hypothetical protein